MRLGLRRRTRREGRCQNMQWRPSRSRVFLIVGRRACIAPLRRKSPAFKARLTDFKVEISHSICGFLRLSTYVYVINIQDVVISLSLFDIHSQSSLNFGVLSDKSESYARAFRRVAHVNPIRLVEYQSGSPLLGFGTHLIHYARVKGC